MHIPQLRRFLLTGLTLTILGGCGSTPKAVPASEPAVMAVSPKPMAVAKPATMPMAEPVVLKFTEASIKAIQAGTKTATIRKGARTFPSGPVRAVGTAGDMVMLSGVTATPKKFGELTGADAKANGSASLADLKTQLGKDYPGIAAGDVVTVIGFRVGG